MSQQQRQREAKRAYWRDVLTDWAHSGLSKTEYARRHDLDYGRLCWWSSHYPHWVRQAKASASAHPVHEQETAETSSCPVPSFVTLQPEAGPATSVSDSRAAEPLRLTVAEATVEVPPDFCERTLDRLLGVLERRR